MNTLLAFLLTIGVLIVVHELGHYGAARACGVQVLRFSIGFGQPLWRRRIGETEWVLSLLPLGGYVKMLDEREAPVPPALLPRAFNRQSLSRRSFIVLAGPLANLVLAVLLYAASHWLGTTEPVAVLGSPVAASLADAAGVRAGDQVTALAVLDRDEVASSERWKPVASMTDLRWQLTRAAIDGHDVVLEVRAGSASGKREVTLPLSRLDSREADAAMMRAIGLGAPFTEPVMGEVVEGGAADRARLKTGDRVLSVDGRPVVDGAGLRALIRASGETGEIRAQRWLVRRAGVPVELTVLPELREDRGQRIGRIEAVVGSPPEMTRVHYGVRESFGRAFSETGSMIVLTLKMFGRMIIGEASLKNLTGPLTIADYAGQSVALGLSYYLGFLAVVSISLGVLNLLPLPMLDGGHLLYYLIEGVTGRPIPDGWIERLQRGGVVLILMMMSLALYNDVARLMGL
ncbi:site-2 protease [Sphaerotilus hippei]|uniref:Zinc metalloprotease n=1 Tax=Sphaerotilus hippei TaxID=744406 RepID=A0A318H4I5_9BURK|nr:RIP metalloprotease RseP [Sphaerotilus hippei]PXW98653.1 site-2 protease [Sphaerotilus hippei]